MRFWALFFVGVLAALAGDEAHSGRFSQDLSVTEFTQAGIKRLSSDQVAVLDALVRRDFVAFENQRSDDPVRAARFSQRLTDDERRTAGLALLTEAELAQLDALVERHASATLARSLLAPLVFYPSGVHLRPENEKTAPEIHGTMSLSYGFGKGYSEKTGSMVLRMDDPAHGFSLSAGYSETQLKSPFPYRDGAILPPVAAPAP